MSLPRSALVGLALALGGCAPQPAPLDKGCILPGQQPLLVAELFFGRDRDGSLFVSDAEWSDFLASVVTPQFPDGLTVFDGYGQWRNPATGVVSRSQNVKIVLIATARSPGLADRLSIVVDTYKARFYQQSVGVITRDSCAAF